MCSRELDAHECQELESLIKRRRIYRDRFLILCGVESLEQIPRSKFERIKEITKKKWRTIDGKS